MKERDATYFTRPKHEWQKRYEALRASFVDRKSAKDIAREFDYSPAYIYLLRHQFKKGLIDFSEPVPEGAVKRRKVSREVRDKIRQWRELRLSAGEIVELLSEDAVELSVRTVERVLAEEGFKRLPRRTRLKVGRTVMGTRVPQYSKKMSIENWDGAKFRTENAGVFLFAPFLAELGIEDILRTARLPGTRKISHVNYFLSFLALKLLGTERYAHVGDHAFDAGLGLFAELNVLPKCTSMSTYSYGLDDVHLTQLQRAFVKKASKLGLYDGNVVNLDFHSIPHYGEESILENHWAGARGKVMKGALTLFAQDAQTKLMLYTDADIRRSETDSQATDFISFWKKVRRGVMPTLVFDSRFTTYAKLSELNNDEIKFITLRRRGATMIKKAKRIKNWKRIQVPHAKRKFPRPWVHESTIELNGYNGLIRQVIMKGNGREEPTFLITNDFDIALPLLVSEYARRWRVENGIAEAVKFFHLNSLSSPILVKVHFDVVMTMIADTLYSMFAQKLRGFEDCNAPKIFRHFVGGHGIVRVESGTITVEFPRRAHNPLLRKVPWSKLPNRIPWLDNAKLDLKFR